jgi:hypothetical protein
MVIPNKLLIVTGCDSKFFPNLRILLGSWMTHMADFEMAVCDFGLSKTQIEELISIPRLRILSCTKKIEEPLLGKTLIHTFLGEYINELDAIMWIDADAFFNSRLPDVWPILEGYDILIDAHIDSIGQHSDIKNVKDYSLRKDDSYFSAGCWIARPGIFLKRYQDIGSVTRDRNFWEGDAFVSAIYLEKLKIRTINGSIWHSRGKTSLNSSSINKLTAYHHNQTIYVIHANAFYRVGKDGRRILHRPQLARLQDYYENIYHIRMGHHDKTRYNNALLFFYSYLVYFFFTIGSFVIKGIKNVIIFLCIENFFKKIMSSIACKSSVTNN